jgi:ubiquinone/menaquinone biosynthesis C-methylase UbiE
MTTVAELPLVSAPAIPDYPAIKTRQQQAWSSGDYAVIGTTLQIVGESLCEAVELRAGEVVLDVAAGNGNASLAAARRWCHVVSTDYVPKLLDRGRARADAECLPIEFRQADAENLPFPDRSFDVVLSTFGVMFTPNQQRAADELARVCRHGGRIGLANWTPDSFIGELFRTIGRYAPPPAGVKSPALWGSEELLRELFGDRIASLHTQHRYFFFRYRSASHWLDTFRTYYGPVLKAFAALTPERQQDLAHELIALVNRHNSVGEGTVIVPGEYLEAVVTVR